MSEPVVSVRGLTKVYGRRLFKRGFRALDGVDLSVHRGDVFGLLGPNGAGKTTLVKILLGLVPRWQGEARVLGRRAGERRAREGVGFLPESHRLPGHLTGRQALLLLGMYSGRSRRWLEERIPGWLERVGLGAAADRKVREYSKGMQQRLGLVQALLHEPELVFLDEPTDGVDPVGRAVIRRIVAELRDKGVTVFLNSHLLMEVELVCDRVVILSRGRIVREGAIEELTRRTGRVSFELDQPREDLGALLDGLGADLALTPRGFELTVGADEQNAVIDRLRSAGAGISRIEPRRLTLEEAFIDLVEREER